VVEPLEAWGGLTDILLTHRDDVADAGRYAAHFNARVWIHEADRGAAPFATDVLQGYEPTPIAPDLLAIPMPGHTRGSVAYLHDDRHLFSGDSLAWDVHANALVAWEDVAWYSWKEQIRSLRRLQSYRFEAVFAGHGASIVLPADEMARRLSSLLRTLSALPDARRVG
jgi:glyoxylase-like metal-dependent hydrolase (beta-lactamase superfamily II)